MDSSKIEGFHVDPYGRENPQSQSAFELIKFQQLLRGVREIPYKHDLKVDELGFYKVQDVLDNMTKAQVKGFDGMIEKLICLEPTQREYPKAPDLAKVFDYRGGNLAVNIGSGREDVHVKGTVDYEPYHVYEKVVSYESGREGKILEEEWQELKDNTAVTKISRNAVQMMDELPLGFGCHIVPDYDVWVGNGWAFETDERDVYSMGDSGLITAGQVATSLERCHRKNAHAVLSLETFLVLYTFVAQCITLIPCRKHCGLLKEVLSNFADVGTEKTMELARGIFTPKLDGEFRILTGMNGFYKLVDRNNIGDSFCAEDTSGPQPVLQLLLEKVGNILYLLGGSVNGINLFQHPDVVDKFVDMVQIIIKAPGQRMEIKKRPTIMQCITEGIPFDGLIGHPLLSQRTAYFKKHACVDVEIGHKNFKTRLSEICAKQGCGFKCERYKTDVPQHYTGTVMVRMSQSAAMTNNALGVAHYYTVTSVTLRPDKRRNDDDGKIVRLLLQPKAEMIMVRQLKLKIEPDSVTSIMDQLTIPPGDNKVTVEQMNEIMQAGDESDN